MFTWNKPKRCGLQLMDSHVRMIEIIEDGHNLQVGRSYTIGLPSCSIVNGAILNETAVVSCIEEIVDILKLQEAQAHLIVPTSNRIMKTSVPVTLDARELRVFLDSEIRQAGYKLPFMHSIINYVRLGSPVLFSQQEDVLAIATPVELVKSYIKIVKGAGLNPVSVEPTLFSLYKAIFRNWQDSGLQVPQRFIHLQTDLGFSEINVYDRGVPIFTYVMSGEEYTSINAYTMDLQMEFKRILDYFRGVVFSDPKDLRQLYLVGEGDWLNKLLQPLEGLFEGEICLFSLTDLLAEQEMVHDPYAIELGLTERGA